MAMTRKAGGRGKGVLIGDEAREGGEEEVNTIIIIRITTTEGIMCMWELLLLPIQTMSIIIIIIL